MSRSQLDDGGVTRRYLASRTLRLSMTADSQNCDKTRVVLSQFQVEVDPLSTLRKETPSCYS